MSKYLKKNFVYWIITACCLFVISCGNNATESNGTATAVSTDNTPTTSTPTAQAVLNSGPLSVFYITRDTFDHIQQGTRLVFAHSIGTNDTIKLSGWQQQGNQYPAGTKFDFKNASNSNLQYGPGVYISNVTLQPAETNKVKNALNNASMLFVVFTPKMVNTYFIGYDITVSATPPAASAQAVTAIAEANPSPPRDSQ